MMIVAILAFKAIYNKYYLWPQNIEPQNHNKYTLLWFYYLLLSQ